MRTLLIPAAVIALALSPSIGECLQAHQNSHPQAWLFWSWAALVVILAILAGEQIVGGA